MSQAKAWNQEYFQPKFLTNSNQPQLDFRHFIKWLKKTEHLELTGLNVLDLGCGNGKNSIYLSQRYCRVTGLDISTVALREAKKSAESKFDNPLQMPNFLQASLGKPWPVETASCDLAIDVLSLNSLSDAERQNYQQELKRVLKPGGYYFLKTLSAEHDKHAANLLKTHPALESGSYVMPQTGIVEHPFTGQEITELLQGLTILYKQQKTSYTKFNGKPFRRHFWLIYARKT